MSTNTAIGVFEPVSLIVLLRFKTQTVQFRQESYGAYRPRPAAQLLSVHPYRQEAERAILTVIEVFIWIEGDLDT